MSFEMPPRSTDPRPSGATRGRLLALLVYLACSYPVAYLAHVPIHHGLTRPTDPIIPALVPWAIAAAVAIVQYARKQASCRRGARWRR